jgi:endonuclease YncB( thermonuclease family)
MAFRAHKGVVCLLAIPWLLFFTALALSAEDLQSFASARLVENQPHDGDSFQVDVSDRQIHVRLYFVDCPESSTVEAQRVREQARYFGLTNATRVVHFGKEATKFVDQVLAKPFTVHGFRQRDGKVKRRARLTA